VSPQYRWWCWTSALSTTAGHCRHRVGRPHAPYANHRVGWVSLAQGMVDTLRNDASPVPHRRAARSCGKRAEPTMMRFPLPETVPAMPAMPSIPARGVLDCTLVRRGKRIMVHFVRPSTACGDPRVAFLVRRAATSCGKRAEPTMMRFPLPETVPAMPAMPSVPARGVLDCTLVRGGKTYHGAFRPTKYGVRRSSCCIPRPPRRNAISSAPVGLMHPTSITDVFPLAGSRTTVLR
jgi:hypothetical protein